jgi:hypothetical protein
MFQFNIAFDPYKRFYGETQDITCGIVVLSVFLHEANLNFIFVFLKSFFPSVFAYVLLFEVLFAL